MTASEAPPEGKSKAPSDRKSRLDPATWAGISSIGIGLLCAAITWLAWRNPGGSEWDSLCLPCWYGPGTFLAALVAVLGIVSARKEKSTQGFVVSVAGLILTVVLFVVSISLLPPRFF
jgi:hypothetical protein